MWECWRGGCGVGGVGCSDDNSILLSYMYNN